MPQPPRSDAQKLAVKAAIETKLREGYRPADQPGPGQGAIRAAAEAAVAAGEFRTLNAFITAANQLLGEFEPDWSCYRPRVYLHNGPSAPFVPSQDHTAEDEPEGEPYTLAAIGDAHDSPHLPDKSRFRWLGAFIAEHQIGHAVSMGDWLTLDSLSTHTDPATHEGLAKPTFAQDVDSFHESQREFQIGLDGWLPKKDHIYGNHDGSRPRRWANMHREVVGGAIDPSMAIDEAFAQWGWRTTPFGEYRFIRGVGFIHAPLVPGTSGKTYGGKTGGQRAANDAMFDIVRGDDHKFYVASAPKIGPVKSPRVFGTATALPPGYIEGYARKNPGDWESGICVLTIWGRRVVGFAFHDMQLLRKRYGMKPAA